MGILAALATAILLPGFTQVAAAPGGGTVLGGPFPGTDRPGLVYLPPGLDPVKRYPVVYLLHGMPGSPSEYVGGVDLPSFADAAIADGLARPFIAVAPAAGPDRGYNGEWAGQWEQALVEKVVPFVDRWLPTIATPSGRVLAGLSAGGYGAVDIGLRHPSMFGAIESWSGYFTPLHDGPFKQAPRAMLAAHDPQSLARGEQPRLARDGTRFFISTGPSHSHWFRAADTLRFAGELRSLGLPVALRVYPTRVGEWREQVDAGLEWAFPGAG
jgi:enterochelin esterase-like enzyme